MRVSPQTAHGPPPPATAERHANPWAYGLLALPLSFAALPLYVHLPRLYGAGLEISLAALGGVLLAARLLDALTDPLIGAWSDRLRNRRLMILAAVPVLALGFFALFHPPLDLRGPSALAWLAGSLVLATLGFGAVSIAYQAWAAQLGRTSAERTRLVGYREGFAIVGVVVASILPTVLADEFTDGLRGLALAFVPLLVAATVVTTVGSGQDRGSGIDRRPAPAWRAWFKVLADAPFRKLLAVFVCNGIAAAVPATLVMFYVSDVLGSEALAGAFLALYFVAAVVALPAWLALARRIGRVRTWLASMAVAMLGFISAPFLGTGDLVPFALICVLCGVALGPDLAMPAALLADLAEARSERTGTVQHGATMGWWNLVGKLNYALAAGLTLPLLEWFGYQPGAPSAALALALIYGSVPLVFKLTAGVLLLGWRNELEAPNHEGKPA